jgi:AcrR family transcriptional regulator
MDRVLTARGIATRQRIVEGAATLIRAQGVANVGLDDIRAASATSKSQLFHYFPDGKSDLLREVARYEADQVLQEQMPMLADLTSWRKWQTWRRRVIEMYDAQRGQCHLSGLTAQLGLADPDTQAVITDLYDRWRAYLADGLRALKKSKEIDPGVEVDQAATAIVAAISGGATLLQATDQIDYLEVGLAEVLDGLRRPGRRPRRRAAAA